MQHLSVNVESWSHEVSPFSLEMNLSMFSPAMAYTRKAIAQWPWLFISVVLASPIVMIISAEPPPPERSEVRTYATSEKSSIPPAVIDHTDPTLECFNLTTPRSYPVDTADCEFVIEAIYHDPAGVMTMTQFSHNPTHSGTYQIPAHWGIGQCLILLTSADETAVDTFRLADVIVKAQKIIDQCPPNSKKHLGGLATIGHRASFFVAVNGPIDDAPVTNRNFTTSITIGPPNMTGLVADPNLATIDELL